MPAPTLSSQFHKQHVSHAFRLFLQVSLLSPAPVWQSSAHCWEPLAPAECVRTEDDVALPGN